MHAAISLWLSMEVSKQGLQRQGDHMLSTAFYAAFSVA